MPSEVRSAGSRTSLVILGTAVLVATIVANPFRETPYSDDWVYATMVRKLLETGRLEMHPWAAANPIFLTIWGAAFARLFGFSFATLRISALVLDLVGLISFFLLCREHRLGTREAVSLSLALFASPLLLHHTFTFMTDVPFMALSAVALLLYTQAIRRMNLARMAGASVVAAVAILVRQFGAAFVPALGLVWLLRPGRLKRLPLFLVGVLMPAAATAWQVLEGTRGTAWTAHLRAADQLAFVKSPTFALDFFWRAMVAPVYLALYALPLIIVALVLELRRRRSSPATHPPRKTKGFALGYSAVCVLALAAGAMLLGRPFLMPLLEWDFEALAAWPRPLPALVTALLVLLGAWVCSAVARRYRDPIRRPSDEAEWLLDSLTFFLLLAQLLYVQFSDRYLLPFLPFVLIVIGREIWLDRPPGRVELRAALTLTLAMLLVSTAWARGTLARKEALWKGSEWLRANGVSAEEVHSESWEWEYYQGSFDRWLASFPDPRKADFNEFFDRYWPEAWSNARYVVAIRSSATGKGTVGRRILSIPYRDGLFREEAVEVIARVVGPSCIATYPQERDEVSWWYWTIDSVRCPLTVESADRTEQVVEFDYWAPHGPISVILAVGAHEIPLVLAAGQGHYRSPAISAPPGEMTVAISKADSSPPERLSDLDSRLASFMIMNLHFRPDNEPATNPSSR